MSTLLINDLSVSNDLGIEALSNIRGGCGLCSLGSWGMPNFGFEQPAMFADPSKLSFGATQGMNQAQNVTTNNGNDAAFVGGIGSPAVAL